jgi:hypothetical protein
MSNLAIRLEFEPLRSLAFGSISGTYMGVGSILSHPARQILVQNLTDQTMIFSWDGITDHFVLPTNGFLLLDITSNKTILHGGFFIAEGSRLYVKQLSAPSSGAVYFSSMYGSDN